MDSRSSLTLVSVATSGSTGRLHIMEGVSPKTVCGRSTDEAIVHDGEWVDEILSMGPDDMSRATSVCARCRNVVTKLRDTVKNPVE